MGKGAPAGAPGAGATIVTPKTALPSALLVPALMPAQPEAHQKLCGGDILPGYMPVGRLKTEGFLGIRAGCLPPFPRSIAG
jgi:hypothetical protein